MEIRDKAALRYISALIVIIPSLLLLLTNITPAINSVLNQNNLNLNNYYYSPTPIHAVLVIVYFFAIIEGLLLLFPSRHVLAGLLLMMESILAYFSSSSFSNSLLLSIMSFSPLAIGGLLAILYKPTVSKLTAFPKTAKRLMSIGAYVTFLAILIDISAKVFGILLLQSALQSQPINPQAFMYPPTLIIIYIIIAILIFLILIFLATIFVSFKLKTDNKAQTEKYSKIACLIGIITIITIVAMSSLFESYGLSIITSNPTLFTSALASGSSTSSANLSEAIALISLIDFALLIIGIGTIFLGALCGLAYYQNLGLIKYVSVNRKFVLYPIIAIIIIGILLSYYSNYQIASDNKLALASLNNKIQMYGGNLRYMLANQSAYDSALAGTNTMQTNSTYVQAEGMYKSLVAISTPQSNISSAFTFGTAALQQPAQQSSLGGSFIGLTNQQSKPITPTSQELNEFDWYTYNPLIRTIELSAFYSLGFLGAGAAGSNLPNYNNLFLEHQEMIIPQEVSPLQSMYELNGYGLDILLIAQELGSVFHSNYLGVSVFHSNYLGNTPSNYTTVPTNNLGVGMGVFTGAGGVTGAGGAYTTTTLLNGSFYDLISGSQMSNGWIVLSTAAQSIRGEGFPEINNRTYTNNLFYTFSLGQYSTYYISEIFYNQTIAPNIDFFGYLNNTIIINLGNLNLTDPQITLYLDGNLTNYTRHYNYLIVYNKHLSTGYHKIGVTIGNLPLAANVYVSPTILSSPILTHATYQNGNYTDNSSLIFSIPNPYSLPLNVTNLSVIGGVNPEPSITPINISEFTYNWSSSYTTAPILVNVTYSRFVKYLELHNNYTNTNYAEANYTTYNLPTNTPYSINGIDFVTLHYSVPTCVAGDVRYYTITFDTNYGKAHIILSANC